MFHLILSSLRFYWRAHLGVLIGALLASAVLTGALLVGDSVDYSLRTFALMRLGKIEYAVNTQNLLFSQDLAEKLSEQLDADAAAALALRGMALHQSAEGGEAQQVNQVAVIGVSPEFWDLAPDTSIDLADDEAAINQKLAVALGVKAGDEVSLRIGKPGLMSRDAPLSSRAEDLTERGLFTVKAVVPDGELGRFSLAANQNAPYNAFVNRAWLQDKMDLAGQINLIGVGAGTTLEQVNNALKTAFQPEDIGLKLRAHDSGVAQLESSRIYLDAESAAAAMAIPDAQGTLTYLVNSIAKGAKSTPYSFMVAGPVPKDLKDDEIIINRWLADQLGAAPGDSLTVSYYELLPSNKFEERQRDFTVKNILEMDALRGEKELTPTFPGLSDVDSCRDWDVGMPMDEKLLEDQANEDYWDAYGQTPKAMITLAAGQAMWSNRFGDLMAVRYEGGAGRMDDIRAALKSGIDPARIGLAFQPVKEQALAAVNQAMDFGGLFLGMSFFLIIAALMLTGLLFVFGVQQRAKEMGALLAVGFRPATLRLLFLGEAGVVALLGAALGAWVGTGYTRVLIYGLSQYWQGAVANAAIFYHASPGTAMMGLCISVVCALCAIALAMWRQTRHPARELLTMDFSQDISGAGTGRYRALTLVLSLFGILAAVGTIVYAEATDSPETVYAFFGAGSLLLMSGLGLCRYALMHVQSNTAAGEPSIARMALQNVARRRGRSLSVIGLLACGCFMVFAVASMQEDLAGHADERWSGTGGFNLFAEATVPVLDDLTAELKESDVDAVAIKVRDGDDASCLNLNHAQTPRLLGVTVDESRSRKAFAKEGKAEALWDLLNLELDDGVIPALAGDSDTLMWGLKKKADPENGGTFVYQNERGEDVTVKLVGKLPMRLSVFQGTLLVSDAAFTRMYPSEDGYRMFLIETPKEKAADVARELTAKFDRFGLDVVPAVNRLREFYAVESTYLAMFLVLGGLGMVLGSAGMGVVVLRNLLERRGELAMLRALGFEQAAVHQLLFTEYGFLLFAGIGVGGVSAAVSMIPTVVSAASSVSLLGQAQLFLTIVITCAACAALAILAGFRKDDPNALRNE